MAQPSQPRRPLSPAAHLLLIFACWKAVLSLVALSSPGFGYDTSTSLFLADATQSLAANGAQFSFDRSWLRTCMAKLLRWDAIYFVAISQRGYLFEQDWAFGSGYPIVVALFSRGICLMA